MLLSRTCIFEVKMDRRHGRRAFLFFIFISWINGVNGIYNRPKGTHMRVAEELLREYGPTFSRPVRDFNRSIVVEFFMYVNQVIELNERDQLLTVSAILEVEWKDEYLTWNTSEYPGVTNLYIPLSSIWRPDIHLYENVDFEAPTDNLVWVSADGKIIWAIPSILITSCQIDARFFPFDSQKCRLRFGPWVYPLTEMDFVTREVRSTSDARQYFVANGVWDLISVELTREVTQYDGYGGYPQIVYELVLTRRPMFHVLTVIIPCSLMSLMNLMVFVLPTESGEKVSLGITNVLALVVFQQLIGETMPPTSDNLPLIYYHFSSMIVTGCLSVVSGVLVAFFHHHDQASSDVPAWVCKLLCKCKVVTQQVTSEYRYEVALHNKHPSGTVAESIDHLAKGTNEDVQMEPHGVNDSNINDKGNGYLTWKDVASLIDRLLLVTCICVTLVSMIITAILFLVLR